MLDDNNTNKQLATITFIIIIGKQNKNTDKGDLGDQYARYRSLLKQQGVRKTT